MTNILVTSKEIGVIVGKKDDPTVIIPSTATVDLVSYAKQGPIGPRGGQGEQGEKGDKGDKGDAGSTFTYYQDSPATDWMINHNLNAYPIVTLYSVGGVQLEGSITNINPNQTLVQFVVPVAGYAKLI